MSYKLFLVSFFILLSFDCGNKTSENYTKTDFTSNQPKYTLKFDDLADKWDEAMPLGNGVIGALVWRKGEKLRVSLDRSDLWDLRPMKNFIGYKKDYNWVVKKWKEGNYKEVQEIFDSPYIKQSVPSKIPAGALEFDISDLGEILSVTLNLKDALCEVLWENGTTFKIFIHANKPLGWYKFENIDEAKKPKLIPPKYIREEGNSSESEVGEQELVRLGYKKGTIKESDNKIVYNQKGSLGFSYQITTKWQESERFLEGLWSVSSKKKGKSSKYSETYVDRGIDYDAFWKSHTDWWQSFWNQSRVKIPDILLEKQWYLEMYKLGSAARKNAPPISLQGVWTADNGKLPPWKGDYHHDLNTQLSYWPTYSGNKLDLEEGYINWLVKYKPIFKKYTKGFYNTKGLNVPGVSTIDGQPMGGWIQYACGVTTSGWLAQHFYLHWRYSMDRKFLEKKAYPWIKDVAIHFEELSEKGSDGRRRFPITSSPELFNNSDKAWVDVFTNFDLANVRFVLEKAIELATELKKDEDASKWKNLLDEFPQIAIHKKSGLMWSENLEMPVSHRHHSHLLAYHPLGIIDISRGHKKAIENSLKHLDNLGTKAWVGYSFSWLGSLRARAFDGEGAVSALRDFARAFCLKNSFHANGDQLKIGLSDFTYRPFTLEGNFAFASGINEILIQSHTDRVIIFPAIPKNWKDVEFKTLRTEGAFLFSAKKEQGKTTFVEVISEKGGILRLKNPFETKKIRISGDKSIAWEGDTMIIQTRLNEIFSMSSL